MPDEVDAVVGPTAGAGEGESEAAEGFEADVLVVGTDIGR